MTTVITRTVARLAVPIILLVSLALFLQGHNQPGGGFIGGVMTATAFALVAVVYSLAFVQTDLLDRDPESGVLSFDDGLVGDYRQLLAVGLALAVASGLAPIAIPGVLDGEDAFLSQTFWILHDLPIYHELEVATALAFDLGVYLTVVGALLTILTVVGAE